MSDLSEHPPRVPDPDEAIRHARELLTAHGVSIHPEFWLETATWFKESSTAIYVPAEIICEKYLNVLRYSIHDLEKERRRR